MPIYDYLCSKHGAFELIHPVPERRGPKRCPRCHALSRPMIAQGVTFSGFRPYTEWNLDPDKPLAITSAAQLDREADARGLRITGGGGLPRLEQRRIEDHHAAFHKAVQRKKHG